MGLGLNQRQAAHGSRHGRCGDPTNGESEQRTQLIAQTRQSHGSRRLTLGNIGPVAFFEGFTLEFIELGEVRLRVRHGGDGPPLVLLHGHPRPLQINPDPRWVVPRDRLPWDAGWPLVGERGPSRPLFGSGRPAVAATTRQTAYPPARDRGTTHLVLVRGRGCDRLHALRPDQRDLASDPRPSPEALHRREKWRPHRQA